MSANTVRFESFETQPEARQRFVNGVPAKLGARAFAILLVPIEHRNRIVSKDELLDRVGPGLVVEENILQVHSSTLRMTLGPRAVVTIPGQRYRFTGVQMGVDEAPPAAVSAPGHEPLTIAVLPFVNGGADLDKDYFADGITDDIITDLSRWRSLAVTSRHSTFRSKGIAVPFGLSQ